MESEILGEAEEEELKKKFLARRETRKSIFQVQKTSFTCWDEIFRKINVCWSDWAAKDTEEDGDDTEEAEAAGSWGEKGKKERPTNQSINIGTIIIAINIATIIEGA